MRGRPECSSTAATTSTAARRPTTSWSGATTSSWRRCCAGEERRPGEVSGRRSGPPGWPHDGEGLCGRSLPRDGAPVIRLATPAFWHTLFADTTDNLRRAHGLRVDGGRSALAEAGHRYEAGQLTAADASAGEALKAVWGDHRDVDPGEQLRMFLAGLDPALATALAARTLE